MSYYVVQPPRRTPVAAVAVLVAAVFVIVLALVAGWAAARPVKVTVDGVPHFLPRGTTVGELQEARLLTSPAGRLIGVNGSVVDPDGGEAPAILRNGDRVTASQHLFPGDTVKSVRGSDRTESIIVTDVPVPFATRYEGSGPLTEMRTLGSPGVRRVTRGEMSGVEITSTVIRIPSDMVILKSRPTGKVVALTFDDGPWPKYTDRVLRVLKRAEVKGTFFMLGVQVQRNPRIAQRVANAGHGIGSHTHAHKELSRLRRSDVRYQIRKGRDVVEVVTGRKTNLLRPPYGAMDGQAWDEARRLNTRIILWDVDSRDWTKPGAKRIENSVVASVRPGSVVLFHDGGGDRRQTIKALPGIIRRLKNRGYTFVTVDELSQLQAEAAAKRRAAKKSPKPAGKKRSAVPAASPPG